MKIVVFDLDETLGYFTELGMFWDCLKQYLKIDFSRRFKMALDKNKLVCAICIAPMILAKAGLLKDINATVWDVDGKQSSYFNSHGIKYTGEDVTVDGNIITANGPDAASAFGEKIAELLS